MDGWNTAMCTQRFRVEDRRDKVRSPPSSLRGPFGLRKCWISSSRAPLARQSSPVAHPTAASRPHQNHVGCFPMTGESWLTHNYLRVALRVPATVDSSAGWRVDDTSIHAGTRLCLDISSGLSQLTRTAKRGGRSHSAKIFSHLLFTDRFKSACRKNLKFFNIACDWKRISNDVIIMN